MFCCLGCMYKTECLHLLHLLSLIMSSLAGAGREEFLSFKCISTFLISYGLFCTTAAISAWHSSTAFLLFPSPVRLNPNLVRHDHSSRLKEPWDGKAVGASHLILELSLLVVVLPRLFGQVQKPIIEAASTAGSQ